MYNQSLNKNHLVGIKFTVVNNPYFHIFSRARLVNFLKLGIYIMAIFSIVYIDNVLQT